MYKCDVNRDVSIVEISPINEFNEGNNKRIIGKQYNNSSFPERNVPENTPMIEDKITTINDSLNIFL